MQSLDAHVDRLARRSERSTEPHRDAVGETYLALRRSKSIIKSPAAYVRRTYRSKVIDEYAKLGRQNEHECLADLSELEQQLAAPTATITMENLVVRSVANLATLNVSRLRDVEQRFVIGVLFQGRSRADVARELGMSEATGRTIFRRARRKLIRYILAAAQDDADIHHYLSDA